MKTPRQAAILRLVRERRIGSQEALRLALADEGFAVTQATLSRDLRALGIVKQAEADGGAYVVPAEPAPPRDLTAVLPTLLTGVDGVGALLVVRTLGGGAGAVAAALDGAGWDEVLGTIAGDDTVLVVARSPKARETLGVRLAGLLRA